MTTRTSFACIALVTLVISAACGSDDDALQRAMAAGAKAYETAKYSEAVIEYRKAAAIDERSGEARLKLSDAYLAAGNAQGSFRELMRAADLMPNNTEVQLKAGGYLLVSRQFEDAAARARLVLAREPQSVDALVLLGNALAGLNDLSGAVAQLQEAADLDPQRGATFSNLAVLLYGKGERKEAEAAFVKAVSINPGSAPAHRSLANYYWSVGRRAEAEKALETSLALDGSSVSANQALALLRLLRGDIVGAEEPLTRAAQQSPRSRLMLADFYVGLGRADDAVKLLQPLVADPQAAAPARLRLAEISYEQGRRSEAHQTVGALLKQHPKDVPLLVAQARWFVRENNLEEAARAAAAAIAVDGEAIAPRYLLGVVEMRRNRFNEARAALEAVVLKNPRAVAARLALSRVLLAQGQLAKGVDLAKQTMELQPDNVTARVLHARGLLAQGNGAGAEQELRELRTRFRANPEIEHLDGLLGMATNNHPRARKAFTEALRLSPTMVEAFGGLVSVDIASRRPEDAIRRLDAAVASSGVSRDILVLAGRSYLTLREFSKAEAALKKLIELDSDHALGYQLLAEVYTGQGRTADALAQFDAIIRQQPSVQALTLSGVLLHQQNRLNDARERYETALKLNPSASVAANNLAWILVETDQDLDRALTLARTAEETLKTHPNVQGTIGWIYYKKHLPLLAIPHLERRVAADAGQADAHYRLGLAYAAVRENVKGRRELEEALRLDPQFAHADDARRVLATLAGDGGVV